MCESLNAKADRRTPHAAGGRCRHAACGARGAPARRGGAPRPQLMPALERQREWQPLVDLPLTIRACVDTM